MLIPLIFLFLSFLGHIFGPFEYLRLKFHFLHMHCLNIVPNSIYQNEYQTLICGAHVSDQKFLLQTSGLIHLLFIYGFQIYLTDKISRSFLNKFLHRNLLLSLLVPLILLVSSFHPASLRAAFALGLRELSRQKCLGWSQLQIAIFSGFLCVSLDPQCLQNLTLMIGWLAAIGFGFFHKRHFILKSLLVSILILPPLAGTYISHPILSLFFSLIARPTLMVIYPVGLLACFHPKFVKPLDFFWQKAFWVSDRARNIFLPIEIPFHFSNIQIWIYLLVLIWWLLFLEHRKLKEK